MKGIDDEIVSFFPFELPKGQPDRIRVSLQALKPGCRWAEVTAEVPSTAPL
jgi:hypothetical protein